MQTIEKFVDSLSSIPDKDRLITNPYRIDICKNNLLHYLQQDSLQLEIRRHDTIDLICSLREVIYFWPVEMQEKMDITCRIQHYEERDLKKMASRLCIYEPDYIFLTQAKMLLDDFYANEFRNRYRENPLANR